MQTWSHSRTARLVIAAVGIFLRYQCRSLAWRLLRRRFVWRTRSCAAAPVIACASTPGTPATAITLTVARVTGGADTGHNCTNCVADVETVNGVARPSYQLG